jgi:hypothetical protein
MSDCIIVLPNGVIVPEPIFDRQEIQKCRVATPGSTKFIFGRAVVTPAQDGAASLPSFRKLQHIEAGI